METKGTPVFLDWIEGLRDKLGKANILRRIRRLAVGNPGDAKSVGEGVFELRVHFGPGYRVYYIQQDRVLIILLCGGDKSTQEKDIVRARELAARIRSEA